MTNPRFVIGLDPLVSSTSLAVFVEGRETPGVSLIVSVPAPRPFRVAANVERTQRHADSVMDAVLAQGSPELVVMAKPSCGNSRTRDDSAPHRHMLVGEIEKRLVYAKIPVAELPSMTVVKWLLGGHYIYPPKDFEKVERAVRDAWRPPTVDDKFRLTTVGLAAAGALAVGIPTRRAVTNSDLPILGKDMTLPEGMKLPDTEPQWRAAHGIEKEKINAA